jgi:putative ABC transport system permease protein
MFDYDKWQEIFESIRKHRLRAGLTAFGVFWGIFMLVILMGAGSGLENGVTRDFDIAKNAVFVWTMRTSMPYKGLQPGRFIQLKNEDVKALRESVPEAKVISPRLPVRGEFSIERGENSASFSVFGDHPEFLQVKPLRITSGRFINQLDIKEKRKVVVIGSRVQEVLFKEDEDPIGKYINIMKIPFKVVGTFHPKSHGEDAIEDAQALHVPLTAVQQAFNYSNRIGWLSFIPHDDVPAATLENKVKSIIADRHSIHPEDARAIGSANIEEEFKQIQSIFTGIRGFSWLVALGTIIAAMVGVGNIMMIIVKERTREIGIRKSLGATPLSIISMIVLEAMVLTGFAGYIGLIAGCVIVEVISTAMANFGMESEFFANPEVDFNTALTAIVVLLASGVLAGLIPGLRAANVDPVVALRD